LLHFYIHIHSYNKFHLSSFLVFYLSGLNYQASGLTLFKGRQSSGIAEAKWDQFLVVARQNTTDTMLYYSTNSGSRYRGCNICYENVRRWIRLESVSSISYPQSRSPFFFEVFHLATYQIALSPNSCMSVPANYTCSRATALNVYHYSNTRLPEFL
jgi:hypothetical protein